MNNQTWRMTQMAMLAALSIVLVAIIHFPIFPIAPFLEYDPADIPIIIGTFLFGLVPGLILTLVVSVVQGLTVSAGGGVIGILMHFLATGSYVLIAALLYRREKSTKSAIVAMALGTLAMCVTMIAFNLVLTPIFMGAPRAEVAKLILPAILPFNAIKAGVNSVIAYVVYRQVNPVFVKYADRYQRRTTA